MVEATVVTVPATPAGTVVDAANAVPLSDQQAVVALVEAADAPLLLVAPPSRRATLTRTLALASARATAPVAVVPADLSPLALEIASGLIASCLADLGLGPALALAADIDDLVLGAVLVESVAKVDQPAPSLVQTARSWLPGSRFAVLQGRRSGVEDVEADPAPAGLVPVAHGATGGAAWAAEVAAGWAAGAPAHELRVGEVFGNDGWAQVAWVDQAGLESRRDAVADRVFAACRWCEQPVVAGGCAFCGFTEHEDDGPEQAARQGGNRA